MVRTASQPRPRSTSAGTPEREPVDRADPDPAERDAEAVQRAVAVVLRHDGGRRGEVQRDRGVARRTERGRLGALQALDPGRERGDLPHDHRGRRLRRAAPRAARCRRCDHAVGRVDAGLEILDVDLLAVIVPSDERRATAWRTFVFGTFRTRSAVAASPSALTFADDGVAAERRCDRDGALVASETAVGVLAPAGSSDAEYRCRRVPTAAGGSFASRRAPAGRSLP